MKTPESGSMHPHWLEGSPHCHTYHKYPRVRFILVYLQLPLECLLQHGICVWVHCWVIVEGKECDGGQNLHDHHCHHNCQKHCHQAEVLHHSSIETWKNDHMCEGEECAIAMISWTPRTSWCGMGITCSRNSHSEETNHQKENCSLCVSWCD